MGQKVDPRILRTRPKLNRVWDSVFYAEKSCYRKFLLEDLQIRMHIMKKYRAAEVSRVVIERPSPKKIVVNIYAKKSGVIIGKNAQDIDNLKKSIIKICGGDVYINVNKIRKPDLEAKIAAQSIAEQLEKRASFRKVMKKTMQSVMKQGASGIRVSCSGRLAGAEIARTEWYKDGRVPLHTLRADIDYATDRACTTYGVIGIKVWIYRSDAGKMSLNR